MARPSQAREPTGTPRGGAWPAGSMLDRIDPRLRARLLGLGTLRQYGAGENLLVEGDRTVDVLLLLDGCVKITASTGTGKAALLAIRVGGDLIGEFAALDGAPRIATATAAGAVVARRIGGKEFRDFLTANADVAVIVSTAMVNKLRWATRRRVDFGGHDVKGRLARVLLELLSSYSRPVPQGYEITVSLTQPELAGIIGASEPAVHKALAELRRLALIDTSYRRLRVRDRDGLARLAGSG
ncbi:Crp/Fnr family transcriptional regulator [Sphaerisporangium dianthi]|uniref:Crp/Fnr family transcriptional regulator n=1 Tax=Sphaerisporangium dianthi TaxID=1436120 RepID=A0ABV9CNF7_9ACTN